ncbi:MAG: YncE family protein [Methylocella sp.]
MLTCRGRIVSVIDTVANTVVATIPVGSLPIGIAITKDGTHAYVVNDGSNNVSVIATASKTTVAVGTSPFGVGFAP